VQLWQIQQLNVSQPFIKLSRLTETALLPAALRAAQRAGV